VTYIHRSNAGAIAEWELDEVLAEIRRIGSARMAELEYVVPRQKARIAVDVLQERGRIVVMNQGRPNMRIFPFGDDGRSAAKERRCLRCRDTFLSHWAGNRLCPSCAMHAEEAGSGLAEV